MRGIMLGGNARIDAVVAQYAGAAGNDVGVL
jgi:hypothetical protein